MVINTKYKINTKALIFGIVLGITSGMLLSSIANAATVPLTPTPKCGDLKYNLPKTDSWKCYDKYFTCPLDPNYIKCDRMAKVGDIKYTKSATANKGWLLCNGATYDATKYTQLASLIGTKFADNDDDDDNDGQYLLPNYIGVFLRGAGSNPAINKAKLQKQTITAHDHQVEYNTTKCESGANTVSLYSGKGKSFNVLQYTNADGNGYTINSVFKFGNYLAATYLCPYRVVLYPYIYAGEPAKE